MMKESRQARSAIGKGGHRVRRAPHKREQAAGASNGMPHGTTASNRDHARSAAMTAAAERAPARRMTRARRNALLQSEPVQGFALISPTFLYALILLVLPILVVFAHSFWTQDYLTIDHTFTLENYRIALTEPIYRDLLWARSTSR